MLIELFYSILSQMARTRTISSVEQQQEPPVEALMRGRGRSRGHARGRGGGKAQPRARAAAPVAEPWVEFDDEVPAHTFLPDQLRF